MDKTLTRNVDKMMCVFYKEYLERIENGMPKEHAVQFEGGFPLKWKMDLFPDDDEQDCMLAFRELKNEFNFMVFTAGGFVLNDKLILHMERRFPRGLKQVADHILKTL